MDLFEMMTCAKYLHTVQFLDYITFFSGFSVGILTTFFVFILL